MDAQKLPSITTVTSLSTELRAVLLDCPFEPSTQLHTLSVEMLGSQSFNSYYGLIASVGVQLTALLVSSSTSDVQWLDDILQAHPRLGAPKAGSAQSAAEQAQLNHGGTDEAEQLMALNEEYEKTFPTLRYVVFVNGRPRPIIMEDMRARIDRQDVVAERAEAIKESKNQRTKSA